MASDHRSDDAEPDRRHAASRADPSPAVENVTADLGALVAAHPATAIATAVGAGYVLGGGVFTRLTSRLLRLALRASVQFALLPFLEQELTTILGVGKTTNGAGGDSPSETRGTHH